MPTIKTWRIGAININGLRGKVEEVIELVRAENIDLLFVSETWWRPSTPPPNDWFLVMENHQQVRRLETQNVVYGTAWIQNREKWPEGTKVEVIHTQEKGHLITVRLSKTQVYLVGTYLPPSMGDTECLSMLEEATERIREDAVKEGILRPRIAILGDFNARLGPSSGDSRTNSRGRVLQEWMIHNGMYLEGFEGDNNGNTQYTFHRMVITGNGHAREERSIPDLIWTNSPERVHRSKVLIRDMCSDHYPIMCEFWAEYGVGTREGTDDETRRAGIQEQPPNRTPMYKLKEKKVREKYEGETEARLQKVLEEMDKGWGRQGIQEWLDENNARISEALEESAKAAISHRKKGQNSNGLRYVFPTESLQQAKKERNNAFDRWRRAISEEGKKETWIRYQEAKRKFLNLVRKRREELFEEFCQKISEANTCEQARMIRNMNKKQGTSQTATKLRIEARTLEEAREHFSNMFLGVASQPGTEESEPEPEVQPPGTHTEIRGQTPRTPLDWFHMMEKWTTVCNEGVVELLRRHLTNGKAPGKSGIKGEHLKYADKKINTVLNKLMTVCLEYEKIPRDWKQARIIPVPKKGDLTKVTNYRPISLLETLRKLLERILEGWIKRESAELDIAQGGFRPCRSTLDQCASLQEALLKITHRKDAREPTLAFLDIKAAYDSVDRTKLWIKCSQQAKMSDPMIGILKELFDDNKSVVTLPGGWHLGDSNPLAHPAGLLQGSILSPLLYAWFINDLPQRLRELAGPDMTLGGRDCRINAILYADDIVLIGKDTEDMQSMLKTCERHSIENNYRYNVAKCEVMKLKLRVTNEGQEQTETQNGAQGPILRVYEQELPWCQNFVYLGMIFNESGLASLDHVNRLVTRALPTLYYLKGKGANGYGFGIKLRACIYKTFLRPKVEYGLAIMRRYKKITKILDSFQHMCLCVLSSVHRNTSASILRVLFGVPKMENRHESLRGTYLYRADQERSPKFLVWHAHEEYKGRKTRGKASSCFHGMERNPTYQILKKTLPRPSMATDWNARQRKLREATKEATRKHLEVDWKENLETEYPENQPKDLQRNLNNISGKRRRRKIELWFLKKIPGKPKRCKTCNAESRGPNHVATCLGLGRDWQEVTRKATSSKEEMERIADIVMKYRF